jgi:hypothetical protein
MDDDDNVTQPLPTPDDALEPKDDLTTGQHPLPEDNDPPAAPATNMGQAIADDHPITDTEIDSQELYDEGLTGATGADAQDETNDTEATAL